MKTEWFARSSLVGCLLVLFLFGTSPAEARICQGDDDHQCWASLSGPNYCNVAVGASLSGVGIACAVRVAQMDDWGGILHCYAPISSSGAAIRGRGGMEAQPSGPFISTNASMRIVSLAITPVNTPNGPGAFIFALRSDGQLFDASTPWPLSASGDPRIFFNPDSASILPGIRDISWVPGVGLVATTGTNAMYVKNGTGWNQLTKSGIMIGSNNNSTGPALYAVVPTKPFMPTAMASFEGTPVDTLPGTLAGGPNQNFGPFGRTRPLSSGAGGAYAVLTCSGTLTPCIQIAGKSGFPARYRWFPYVTGDIADVSPYPMPWTIQDGAKVRGVDGEVWVIAGFQHLKFWAP